MKRRRAKMDNSSVKHGAPFCREPIEPGSMAAIKYISCYFQKQRDRQNDDGHIKGCHIIQCGGNRGKEQKEKKNICLLYTSITYHIRKNKSSLFLNICYDEDSEPGRWQEAVFCPPALADRIAGGHVAVKARIFTAFFHEARRAG